MFKLKYYKFLRNNGASVKEALSLSKLINKADDFSEFIKKVKEKHFTVNEKTFSIDSFTGEKLSKVSIEGKSGDKLLSFLKKSNKNKKQNEVKILAA